MSINNNPFGLFMGFKNKVIQRFLPPNSNSQATIKAWQARFFAQILFYLAPLSIILYIPSLIMSLKEGLISLAIIDTLAFILVQFIFFSNSISLLFRQLSLLITLYILGIALLYFLGWSGPGLVYLLGFSAFSTLIYSNKAGFITWGLNIIIFIAFAITSSFNLVEESMLVNFEPAAIITIGLNFILLNLVLVITISSLVKGLQNKIESEHEIQKKLEKEIEDHKKAKLRAQESDRLKSAFLANMSHEIRTPMNGILGFAQLLGNPDLSGEKQKEFIEIIEESGIRMLNIINNIIDISKIESGQMEVNYKAMNINEQIESVHAFFKHEVEKNGISFSCKKPLSNNNAYINTDTDKVYAILVNLIQNAIKYSQGNTIEFGYEEIDGFIKFYVKDNGVGIPLDKQKSVFERFIQVETYTSKAVEGSGLGLAISKAYVELLGGKIWIESEAKKGTIFFFTIPIIKAERDSLHIINKENLKDLKSVHSLKVLIVEDEEFSSTLINCALENLTREILFAKNGVEAVAVAKENPDIDLILMDIRLPLIDGYDATKYIRKFNENVIIIAQTAYGFSSDKEKALEAGCNDYISKPIDRARLLALISNHL